MADIAPQPFINYGLSQAQQGQAQADTALKGQQASAAAMQNQIMATRLPFIMKMYQQMQATSDTSGVDGQGEPGGPLKAKEDALAEHGYDPEAITKKNASKYVVPEWTDQEKQNNLGAAASGDDAVVKYFAMQRQQRLDTLRQRAGYQSYTEYEKYVPAATATAGNYALIKQTDKPYAAWLDRYAQQQAEQGNPVDKDAMARGYARYQTADLHKYTGRKVKQVDGHNIDEDTGLPVAGVPDIGMSPKDSAEFVKSIQTPQYEVPSGIPGQTKKVSAVEFALGPHGTVQQYLSLMPIHAVPTPDQISTALAGKPATTAQMNEIRQRFATQAAQGAAQGNGAVPYNPADHAAPDPANPGKSVPMPPAPKKIAPPAAGRPAAQPTPAAGGGAAAPAPQGGQPPAAAQGPAPGGQSAAPFTGKERLDNVDVRKLPKYSAPVNAPGTTGSTQQGLDIQAQNKEKYDEMRASGQSLAKSATERGLLDQAEKEIAALRANPRMVGPGSEFDIAWNKFKAYATGKSPDPLTERQMLDKVLLMLGAANVSAATATQGRVGQQEYMKLLTEGNPSPTQALETISRLVKFSRYNNEFDTRLQNTRLDALNQGANPFSAEFLGLGQGRNEYVQARMSPKQSGPKWSDEQVSEYMKHHNLKDEKAVRKALGM